MSNRIFRKNSVPQSFFGILHIRRKIPQPRHLNRATFFPTLKYMRSQSRRRRREAIQVTKESPTFPPAHDQEECEWEEREALIVKRNDIFYGKRDWSRFPTHIEGKSVLTHIPKICVEYIWKPPFYPMLRTVYVYSERKWFNAGKLSWTKDASPSSSSSLHPFSSLCESHFARTMCGEWKWVL